MNLGLLRRIGLAVAAPLIAAVSAVLVSSIVLQVSGSDPVETFRTMIENGIKLESIIDMLNRATPLYLSAIAAAIGFRMNLFNIGVEGQYLFAALIAAEAGSRVSLPAVLHVAFILVVAMAAGALWASISGVLKVYRNIHEVISTIMLNYIALSVIQWLFENFFRDDSVEGLNVKTTIIAESGQMPDLVDGRLNAMFLVALATAAAFWVLVYRSRFGFRLRASGYNATAAEVAGIGARRMVIAAMLISGAIAGLVAMYSVVGETYAYGPSATPTQFGFAGITVALLGRNHPIGIVIAALLFGFLDSTSAVLQLADVPNSIVKVMQSIIVLAVVIVNEATIRRLNARTAEQMRSQIDTGEAS